MGVDKKKYLLSKKSYHQYEVAVIEEELKALEGGEAAEEVADEPANKGAAKQAAARTAAANKAKAKPKVEEEAEESSDEGDGLDFLDDAAEESNEPTEDDVKVAVKKFVAAFGKEKVVTLLAKFKAKAIQDIKAKDYAAFIDLVNKALAKHKK